MRDWLIALFTPLARRLSGVDPNALTVAALISGLLAALCLGLTGLAREFYLAAALLISLSGAADSLDGIVARMHGRSSTAGDFLDHFCDRVVDAALFAGLAFSEGADRILGLLVTSLILLNGNLGTQIQASFGHRPYRGGGKAELFAGTILFAIFMGLAPAALAATHLNPLGIANLFLMIVALLTLASLAGRLRLAITLCRSKPRA
jgi:phosphatidylglycerophosphate synthase